MKAAASEVDWAVLREHLVASRLAGDVATTPARTLHNCRRLVDGRPEYTFGLPDWRDATVDEAVAAVVALCGGDPSSRADPEGLGTIDPDLAIAGIRRHRDGLAAFAAAGGGRVLLATGHPTGLLPHYAAIARKLQATGSELLAPLDDVRNLGDVHTLRSAPLGDVHTLRSAPLGDVHTLRSAPLGDVHTLRSAPLGDDGDGGGRGVRFLDGVACVWGGGDLYHTHLARYMEAMLDELGGGPGVVDLVVADHGMAGAAIARDLPTLSIADVNDPALPLAQARGRTDGVLCIDDNLAPRLFVPVTSALLSW